MTTREIPVVRMGGIANENFVRRLGEALETYGFASVIGHSVSEHRIRDVYEAARKIFALPEEEKKKCWTPENGGATGYTPFGTEHAKDDPRPDLKEFWHVMRTGFHIPNVWPKDMPEFELAALELYAQLDRLASHLLGAIGTYLYRDEEGGEAANQHLRKMATGGNSLLRVLHYPPIEGEPDGMRAAPHEDINFITLLPAASAEGLEVKLGDDWIPVNNPPDAIVVQSCDMLAMHTFGRMPSMTHRVVNPKDSSTSRYSMPFFVHPRSDVPLVTAGAYLQHRLKEIGLI